MTTVNQFIFIAKTQVGVRETGNNHTKYAAEVPELRWAQNQPWCSTFISWIALKSDARDIIPCTASCETGAAWFKHLKRWYHEPRVGDIVYYGPNGGTHVELVTEVEPGRFRTIGGNTSGALKGAYHNGDGVYEKWIDRDESRIHGFGRPAYEGIPKPKPPTASKPTIKLGSKGAAVKTWQAVVGVKEDGIFGAVTEKATKAFQTKNKLDPDGVVGPSTWQKA